MLFRMFLSFERRLLGLWIGWIPPDLSKKDWLLLPPFKESSFLAPSVRSSG